jgi:hypothetical protein
MNIQEIIEAAVECLELGPEDQDAVLRFGMRLEGMSEAEQKAGMALVAEVYKYCEVDDDDAYHDPRCDGMMKAANEYYKLTMNTPERPTTSAEDQAAERYPMPLFENHLHLHTTDAALAYSVVGARQEGYAAALVERAIPAEQALRLAMDYINKCPCDPDIYPEQRKAWETLRADPIAAKMLGE